MVSAMAVSIARRLKEFWGAAAIFGLGLAAYAGQLVPGWAASGGDIAGYVDPYDRYIGRAWQQGRVPLWNPDVFMGVPLLANFQAESLYPPNLILLFLPADVAIAWSTAIHIGIAGAGMYLYAWRGRGLGRLGGAVAAVIFMLGPYLTAHLAHVNQIHSLAWAPWLMLACDRAVVRPRLAWAPVIAGLVALVILAGHPQQAYFTFVLAGLAAAARLWPDLRSRAWTPFLRRLPIPLGGLGLGFAISAAQLLPAIELFGLGYRSAGLGRGAVESGIYLKGLVATMLPHYSSVLPPEIAGVAIGTPALFLACLAVLSRWRRPWVPVWAGLSVAGLWAATGEAGRMYPVVASLVPGLALFRAPERLLIFMEIGIALLAGLGARTAIQLSHAQTRPGWRRRGLLVIPGALGLALLPAAAVTAGATLNRPASTFGKLVFEESLPVADIAAAVAFASGAALLCLIGLRYRSNARLGAALLLLAGFETWLGGEPIYSRHPVPSAVYDFQSATQEAVPPDPNGRYLTLIAPFDVLDFDARAEERFSPDQRVAFAGYIGLRESMAPNGGIGEGRPNVDGYDGGMLPLRAYVDFRAPVLPPGSQNRPDYVLPYMTSTVGSLDWAREAGIAVVITNGSDPNPPGCRCWVTSTRTGAVTIWRPAGEPPTRAWVEAGGRRVPARISRDSGEKVEIELPDAGSGSLILADTHYPGWKATVDGVDVPIRTYHGLLRSVEVPAGARHVTFSFEPASVRLGAWISALALVVTAGLGVLAGFRRRLSSELVSRERRA